VRLTYEVREVIPEGSPTPVAMRVLSIQIDIMAQVMPGAIQDGKHALFRLSEPFVKLFFPLHQNVGASINSGQPVPRVSRVNAADEANVHYRTPVLMRFSADHLDPGNAINKAKAPTTLLGPDGKPV
jgi:hypothetical protein